MTDWCTANRLRHQTLLLFLIKGKMMENILKGLEEDYLGLTIWTTLFRVLFLTLLLFKRLSFNIIKKDWFFKVKLSTSSPWLLFERKGKRLRLLSFHERSTADKVFFKKKESFAVFLLILKTKTANKKFFCKRVYNIIL